MHVTTIVLRGNSQETRFRQDQLQFSLEQAYFPLDVRGEGERAGSVTATCNISRVRAITYVNRARPRIPAPISILSTARRVSVDWNGQVYRAGYTVRIGTINRSHEHAD